MIMIPLLTVPIYAFSEKTLKKRVAEFGERIRTTYDTIPEEIISDTIDRITFPQRSTLLNHVIGYITVSYFGNDIYFDIYLPVKRKKYIWNSKQRGFIQNITANGTHFNIGICENNSEVQHKVWEMLNAIIKEHVPGRYYIDKECFRRLNASIDYYTLIEKAKEDK